MWSVNIDTQVDFARQVFGLFVRNREVEIINEREGLVDFYRHKVIQGRWKGRQVEFSEI